MYVFTHNTTPLKEFYVALDASIFCVALTFGAVRTNYLVVNRGGCSPKYRHLRAHDGCVGVNGF